MITTAPHAEQNHRVNGHRLTREDAGRAFADAREVAILADFIDDGRLLDAAAWLLAEDFKDDRIGCLLATLRELKRSGEPHDFNSFGKHCVHVGLIPEKVDPDLFCELAKSRSTSDPIGIAHQIHIEGERRRFQSHLELIRFAADDPSVPTNELARMVVQASSGITTNASSPKIVSAHGLVSTFPHLRREVIRGIVRVGEIINVIAKSKVGKSWFGYAMGLSVAFGILWLGRFETTRGRVLLIDNELHPETLASRISAVLSAMGSTIESCDGWFDVLSLRGQSCDVHAFGRILRAIEPGTYSLVICDAFYRILPDGTSENDNAQMTAVYNLLNEIVERLGAALVLIHHATKGGQGDKDVTDVGSGAGAISRAADTHLVLRPHEEENAAVLDARMRSWEPIEPIGLRWICPLWQVDEGLNPESLKGRKVSASSDEAQQQKMEGKTQTVMTYINSVYPQGVTKSRIKTETGINHGLNDVLQTLLENGQIETCQVIIPSNGMPFDGYRAVAPVQAF